MSTTVARLLKPLESSLNSLGNRVRKLEMAVTTPGFLSAGTNFDELNVGPEGARVSIVATAPIAVTGVGATTGAYYDTVYADVSWTPPVTGAFASSFEVEVAKKIAGLYQAPRYIITAGTNVRFEPLEPNTQYGVRVTPRSRIGVRGPTSAWVDFTTGEDTTIPPAVTGLTVLRGATSVVVTFTPLTEALAPDVVGGNGLYEIQIDTANTFNTGNLRTTRTSSWVVAFNDILAEGNWYARVSAIDSSGNQGAYTVAGPSTAGGVTDAMVVAGLSAAKITFGEMSGDRITANTLDVAKLKTGSLTTQIITLNGGSLQAGSPPTTGLLLNSQGMRLYQAGVQTLILDAATGAATFKGTVSGGVFDGGVFQTSSAVWPRIVIDATTGSAQDKSAIYFHSRLAGLAPSRQAAPGSIKAWDDNTDDTFLEIRPPQVTATYDVFNVPSITLRHGTIQGGLANEFPIELYGKTKIYGAHVFFEMEGGIVDNTTLINRRGFWIGGSTDGYLEMAAGRIQAVSGSYVTNKLNLNADGGVVAINSTNKNMQTTTSAANVRWGTIDGELYQSTSSERFKRIVPMTDDEVDVFAFDKLMAIKPTKYRPLHPSVDDPDREKFGFTVEQVYSVWPEATNPNFAGEPIEVDWNFLIAACFAGARRNARQLQALEARVDALSRKP